ncbi:peptidase S41 [Bacteroidaceae bacterium HV4-6-C5C]|jgi:Periplasmic protease|nr:peptidase S41 [Bacteroidaceae bacterium HV4-6-C5C]
MKARNLLFFLLGALTLSIYLASCGEDRWPEYAVQTQTDRWIDDSMRVWYYWNEDMPSSKKLNYFSEPATFFKSLLSSEDKYSTIDSIIQLSPTRSALDLEYGYGIQFELDKVENNDTAYYARILYTVKNSPAATANLSRGQWILSIDDKPITKKNYTELYMGSGIKVVTGYYDSVKNTILANKSTTNIGAMTPLEDNPVYYYNTYTEGDNRIGYLVYNRFTPGTTANPTAYDQALLNVSKYFAGQNVNQFILDLRYNNGGHLSSAQLLSTILAPSSALGKRLGYLEFNKQSTPRNQEFYLDQNLIPTGSNLNLNTLYILTSSQTASASEMLINCLKPYIPKIVLIGQTTVGKNVASKTFINKDLQIAINPIVCKIYNSLGTSDYSSGFKADYSLSEISDLKYYLPFGDTNEALLSKALSLITNKSTSVNSTKSLRVSPIISSMTRKADRAVRLE